MAEVDPAKAAALIERHNLLVAVRTGELTPSQAEAQAQQNGLPPFVGSWQQRRDMTDHSTWWLPVAVLFYAWQDLAAARREYKRFVTWGREIWRDPQPEDMPLSLEEAEDKLRADLVAGLVRGFGTNADEELVPVPREAWQELNFARDPSLTAGRADGTIVYSNAFVLRHDVVPLWLREAAAAGAVPQPMHRVDQPAPAGRGGRVMADHWHDMWAEVCRIIHEEGVPPDRLTIVKRMQQWFTDQGLDAPQPQKLNPVMDRLFRALGR